METGIVNLLNHDLSDPFYTMFNAVMGTQIVIFMFGFMVAGGLLTVILKNLGTTGGRTNG